jgi:hypothetical protein
MKAIYFTAIFMVMVSSCGGKYDTGKKFHDEKDKRFEAEKQLNLAQSESDELRTFLKNVTPTENYLWTWRQNQKGLKYPEAEKNCKSIGFDFPSEKELAEGESAENIKKIIYLDVKDGPQIIFVKGKIPEGAFAGMGILCVKPK